MPLHSDTTTPSPSALAVIVFLSAAIASAVLIWQLELYRFKEDRSRVTYLAGSHAQSLQHNIERTLSVTYTLAALVRHGNGSIPDFHSVASRILPYYPGASQLVLAPEGIIRDVVPLAGNEMIIGLNLLEYPAYRREAALARDTGNLVLAGPLELAQGGTGVIGRLPVFLDGGKGKPAFWGFTNVVLRFPEALTGARLPQLVEQGFNYELWRLHPESGQRVVISASAPATLMEPVEATVELPNGNWTLSVTPAGGWSDPAGLALKIALGLLVSLLLAALAKQFFKLRTHEKRLETLVAQRTAEIMVREAELGASNERLAIALEATSDGLWDWDIGADKVYFSPRFRELLGYSDDQSFRNGFHFKRSLHPEDRNRAITAQDGALLRCSRFDETYRLRCQDGSYRWFRGRGQPLQSAGGKPERFVGTLTDITDLKSAELALRESEERYRFLFDLSPDAVLVFQDRHITLANQAAARLLRAASPQALAGRNIREFVAQEDWPLTEERIGLLENGAAQFVPARERRMVALDGAVIDVESSGALIVLDGRPAVLTVTRDISEHKQTLAEVARVRDQLDLALDAATIAMWDWDARSNSVYLDARWAQMLGEAPRERIAKQAELAAIVHPDDIAGVIKAQVDVVRGVTENYNVEQRVRTVDGSWIWIESRGKVVSRDAQGRALRTIGTNLDISERKRAEDEIRRFNETLEQRVRERTEELEASNRELEAFSYSVSHDLRTPLRGIDGFAYILAEDYGDRMDDTGRSHLQRIRRASQRLSQTIDDLIELARITRLPMHRSQIDLSSLVRAIALELTEGAMQRCEFVIPEHVTARADPALLAVVLKKLLENALKFAGRKENVHIEFGVIKKEGRPAYFVRDNGIGFDMAHAGMLFKPFQRLHNPDEFSGTGIGLATVARIIHRHGGEVWAEGAPEEGATFYFTL